MCIERKTAWAFAGHNYDTEIEAVKAAIDSFGKKLVKDHASDPGHGLRSSDKLADLLIRYRELSVEPEVASTESPEGTHPEELEGTQEPDGGRAVESLVDQYRDRVDLAQGEAA